MRVFIAHAPQDHAHAEALAETLRQRGLLPQLETGEVAMLPMGVGDTMVGLISKNFAFSPFKLRLEKRLLDAWADGQLIQVKLDHAFAPVGLRDLPAIDASFEAQRDFTWMKVADAVRTLRAARAEQSSAPQAPSAAAPPPSAQAPASPAPIEWEEQTTGYIGGGDYDSYGRAPPMQRKRIAAKRGAGLWVWLLSLAILGAAGAAFYAFTKGSLQAPPPDSPPGDQPAFPTPPPDYTPPVEIAGIHFSQPILMATAIVVGLILMAVITIRASQKAALERRMGKPSKSRNKFEAGAAAAEAAKPAAPPVPAPEPVAAEPLVFISYARADQTSVDPLAKAVKDSGHPIWIDTDAIDAGTSWAGEIVRAIKSAGHVLIMCSPRSFESDQVKREVYLADRYKKRLLPVFLEAAEPPEDFEYFFAGVQWLKLHEAPEADRPGILARALPAA